MFGVDRTRSWSFLWSPNFLIFHEKNMFFSVTYGLVRWKIDIENNELKWFRSVFIDFLSFLIIHLMSHAVVIPTSPTFMVQHGRKESASHPSLPTLRKGASGLIQNNVIRCLESIGSVPDHFYDHQKFSIFSWKNHIFFWWRMGSSDERLTSKTMNWKDFDWSPSIFYRFSSFIQCSIPLWYPPRRLSWSSMGGRRVLRTPPFQSFGRAPQV